MRSPSPVTEGAPERLASPERSADRLRWVLLGGGLGLVAMIGTALWLFVASFSREKIYRSAVSSDGSWEVVVSTQRVRTPQSGFQVWLTASDADGDPLYRDVVAAGQDFRALTAPFDNLACTPTVVTAGGKALLYRSPDGRVLPPGGDSSVNLQVSPP